MLTRLNGMCTVQSLATFPFVQSKTLTADGRPVTALLDEAPFKQYVADQLIGTGRTPKVPVLMNHSLADDVIPYSTGKALAKRWCKQGSNVSFNTILTPTHVGGYVASIPATVLFLEARFAGLPQISSCWRL
jgi:hypothetical protein